MLLTGSLTYSSSSLLNGLLAMNSSSCLRRAPSKDVDDVVSGFLALAQPHASGSPAIATLDMVAKGRQSLSQLKATSPAVPSLLDSALGHLADALVSLLRLRSAKDEGSRVELERALFEVDQLQKKLTHAQSNKQSRVHNQLLVLDGFTATSPSTDELTAEGVIAATRPLVEITIPTYETVDAEARLQKALTRVSPLRHRPSSQNSLKTHPRNISSPSTPFKKLQQEKQLSPVTGVKLNPAPSVQPQTQPLPQNSMQLSPISVPKAAGDVQPAIPKFWSKNPQHYVIIDEGLLQVDGSHLGNVVDERAEAGSRSSLPTVHQPRTASAVAKSKEISELIKITQQSPEGPLGKAAHMPNGSVMYFAMNPRDIQRQMLEDEANRRDVEQQQMKLQEQLVLLRRLQLQCRDITRPENDRGAKLAVGPSTFGVQRLSPKSVHPLRVYSAQPSRDEKQSGSVLAADRGAGEGHAEPTSVPSIAIDVPHVPSKSQLVAQIAHQHLKKEGAK